MHGAPPQDSPPSFANDSPLDDPAQDRFSRSEFSRRVAQTIATRSDPGNLVIAIYGEWGDGKTTVLNFIEAELHKYNNVIPVRFNPWLFSSEEALVRSFFDTLTEALGSSMSTKSEEMGETLKKYGSVLSAISIGGFGASISPGKALAEIGSNLSAVNISQLKSRVGKILSDSKRKLVVFIDDIDRLDVNDIHSIFRLVKLAAGVKIGVSATQR